MKPYWEKHKVDVPEGTSGDWRVEKFSVSKKKADHNNAMASFSASLRGSHMRPGDYTRLMRKGTIVMTDTFDEIRGHMGAINAAKGHVLIVGLGLGMVTRACLEKPEVTLVTVVEKSPDVIKLVGHHYADHYGNRLEIVEADIFEWKPPKGVRYNVAWFDIWDDICGDNLEEMTKLKRKFGRRADWKGCWQEERLRAEERRWKRQHSGWPW